MASNRPGSFEFIGIAVLCLVLCLMSQEISATSRRLIVRRDDDTGGSYNDRINTTDQGLMKKEMMVRTTEDYGGEDDESSPHDYSDYDFYRKHGDVPSPGAGH